MRWLAGAPVGLVWFLCACLCAACSKAEAPPAPAPPAPAPIADAPEQPSAQLATAPVLPRSPKPGERVRQPELDGYCDGEAIVAFYYHGGNPAVRVARKDQCSPLYLTECEAEGRCYPPRDQEPGMWCCSPRSDEQPAIHATR